MSELARKLLLTIVTIIGIGALITAHLAYILSIPSEPVKKPEILKIAAVGDSITDGEGDINDTLRENSYPARLQELLSGQYQVYNYGSSGGTLIDSGDIPYRQSEAFRLSTQEPADIIFIMLGTNDSKPHNWNADAYAKQLHGLITTYENLPGSPAVYAITPPAAYENDIAVSGSIIENEIVPIVYKVTEQTNIPVIDIFALTKGHPEYFHDGVHPTFEGHKLIADTVYDALQ